MLALGGDGYQLTPWGLRPVPGYRCIVGKSPDGSRQVRYQALNLSWPMCCVTAGPLWCAIAGVSSFPPF
jgi:hypothetical protein